MMQPFRGAQELLRQAEIDEIAGHRDVVRLLLDDVAGDKVENVATMHEFPPAMPIDIAEHALRHELAAPGPRHRAQMNVGEMGEGEHESFPLDVSETRGGKTEAHLTGTPQAEPHADRDVSPDSGACGGD